MAIVDATVVEAARSRRGTADPEAGSRAKLEGRRRGVWGWQAFVNADGEADQETVRWTVSPPNGFIRAKAVTPGHRHEITALHRLMRGGETQLYADAAYSAGWVRRALARAGLGDRVQRKGYRNRPLSAADRARNKEIAVTRGRVEAIFGALKRSWGLARTRFLGEPRNAAQLALTAIAWNLRNGATLRRSGA
ncbi:MAG: transposase [Pseudomonadota bacterium]